MAKRKRLSPAAPRSLPADLEIKGLADAPLGLVPKKRAPIAQVAGDAARQSAIEELAFEIESARTGGRLVQVLPLEAIAEDHMVRDRMVIDPADMDSLKSSIRARGQQTPIEVVELGQGAYGLISGWRRLHAFRALQAETGEGRFGVIQALIKPIETVSDSYVAMVEENEIRTNLSFYERARLACEAAELGIYPTPKRAVSALFANTTPARRSKIASFIKLHETLGPVLRFPAAIPERLGLALATALEDAGFATRLRDALRKTPADSAGAERKTLEKALRKNDGSRTPRGLEVCPGVRLETGKGRVVLSGPGVTEALTRKLTDWLRDP